MSDIADFDYRLPKRLIAQAPLSRRSDARMIVVDRRKEAFEHRHVRDLPGILTAGDCLVLNDTRVVPARLVGHRVRTGGRWEGLFLAAEPDGTWRVLGRTRGHLEVGETVRLMDSEGRQATELAVLAQDADGTWIVRPETDEPPATALERVGWVPLPPYIRKGQMVDADREHYQTVFANKPGAVAAPTAGLHFTERLIEAIAAAGVTITYLTLHVGLGTFRPITTSQVGDHRMHAEWGCITEECVRTLADCRRRGGRVVAVGTTCLRLLETAAASGELKPFSGQTDLFIRPGHCFRAVDALLTNFHLPRTTLLVLVYAFGGRDLIARAYAEAIREEYRFFSYGDAMLIL